MLLTCPNCHTKYRISDENIKSEGSKLRCSKCTHVFTAAPEDGEMEYSNEQLTETQEVSVSEDESGESDQGTERHQFYTFEKKANYKKFSIFAIPIAVVLAGIIVTGYFFYPQLKEALPFLAGEQQIQTDVNQKQGKGGSKDKDVQEIALRNVRQYMVENEKIGQLLVIEGKAENKSDTPKKKVELRAQLYDDEGNVIQEKSFFSGYSISLFQLQILSRDKIENKLTPGDSSESKVLAPEEELKFMNVFFNPSRKLSEFSLQVVGAENTE